MLTEQAHYRHDLGEGAYLDAYAIDPKINEAGLKEIVNSQRGNSLSVLENVRGDIIPKGYFDSFGSLNVTAVDETYQAPEKLSAFRNALGIKLDSEGKFSGPLPVIKGDFGISFTICKGGYYDFMATQLDAVPGDLLPVLLEGTPENLFMNRFRHAKGDEGRFLARYSPELIERFKAGSLESFARDRGCNEKEIGALKESKVGLLLEQYNELVSRVFDIEVGYIKDLQDANYPTGKNLEELMPELGITNEQRARYLGFAFLMLPENGREFSFVQRGKNLGIAADCISTTGSTPPFNKTFLEEGFDFGKFYEGEVKKEMGEEYALNEEEFKIRGFNLFDHKKTLPHAAIKIETPVTTEGLAKRIYGDEGAIEEHPVLYSVPLVGIRRFLETFNVYPGAVHMMDMLDKQRG